jgi:hypothetical protein
VVTKVCSSCDVLIVGSSPILLIEGLMRARLGQLVLFVEDGPRGGAWYVTHLDGIADVEGACHLMDNRPGAYAFLQEVLGIAMEVVDPPPEILKADGRRFTVGSRGWEAREALAIGVRIPAVAAIRLGEWISGGRLHVRRAERFSFSRSLETLTAFFRPPVCYPVGGSPAMLDRLEGELRSRGAEFASGCVDRVELPQDGRPVVALEDGTRITTRELVVSDASSFRSLRVARKEREFALRDAARPHLLIEVCGLERKLFSYLHLHNDRYVERLSDVTSYCRDQAPGSRSRVLVVQLKERRGTDARSEATMALKHLEGRGVLPAGVGCVFSRSTEVRVRTAEPPVAQALRALSRHDVVVLPSRGDLSLAVVRNRRRWLELSGRVDALRQ